MKAERLGAWLLLAAITTETLGLSWDIQWHNDVGPDTFFTLPHLVMYLGTATAGLTSLAVVLHRSFRRPDPAVRTAKVLGVFKAPIPFLVAGLGAAGSLLYGLTDLWWHTVYGFDAVATSPPHVAMTLCSLVTACGGVMAFSSMRGSRSGRVGLALYLGVACFLNIFLALSTPALPWVNEIPLAVTLLCVLGSVLTAAVTRSPALVVLVGVSFATLQTVTGLLMPAITRTYADAIDLPLRDYVDGTPFYAWISPFAMLPAALLIAGALAVGKRFSSPKAVVPVVAAVGAAALSIGYLVQFGEVEAATVTAAAVLGLGIGWVGWRMSSPLRNLMEA